jgi:hypothetical protein
MTYRRAQVRTQAADAHEGDSVSPGRPPASGVRDAKSKSAESESRNLSFAKPNIQRWKRYPRSVVPSTTAATTTTTATTTATAAAAAAAACVIVVVDTPSLSIRRCCRARRWRACRLGCPRDCWRVGGHRAARYVGRVGLCECKRVHPPRGVWSLEAKRELITRSHHHRPPHFQCAPFTSACSHCRSR